MIALPARRCRHHHPKIGGGGDFMSEVRYQAPLRCAERGCSTLLSAYSNSRWCAIHERSHPGTHFGNTGVEIVIPTPTREPEDRIRIVQRPPEEPVERYAAAFLTSYKNANTRRAYEQHIREWLEFCEGFDIKPLLARRSHFDLFMRVKESDGNGAATVNRKMTALVMFYQWLVDDDYLDKNTAKLVRRPVAPPGHRDWLSGVELARWMKAAEIEGGYTYALACLLGYNALRISEIYNANVTDMARERHNHTLRIVGKGNKPAVIALNGPTKWAIDEALDGRTHGALILSGREARLTRDSAGRTVRRVTRNAGIKGKNITPHSLRHSAITALHDAGADPRAVMGFARHARLATTQIYDHKVSSLDDHGAYRLSGYVAERLDW